MTNSKNCLPKYSRDGNKAVVYYGNRKIYLGHYGSTESQKNYREFLDKIQTQKIIPHSMIKKNAEDITLTPTLGDLFTAYLESSNFSIISKTLKKGGNEKIIRKNQTQYEKVQKIIKLVFELFPQNLPTESFTAPSLIKTQELFTKQPVKNWSNGINGEQDSSHIGRGKTWSRIYCNEMITRLRKIFTWGHPRGLVSATTLVSLNSVELLEYGQSDARETEGRTDAPVEVIESILPYLLPCPRTIIRLLLDTGARPSEITRMRVGEINRNRPDGIWLYRPTKHKNSHRGKTRVIAFGQKVQQYLAPYLMGKKDSDIVLSPEDTLREQKEYKAAHRKTPKTPSQKERDKVRKEHPKRKVNESYNKDSLNALLHRAANRANKNRPIEHPITPYMLRHTAITRNVETLGIEAASKIAGHSTIKTTEGYDHSAEKMVIEITKRQEKTTPNIPNTITPNWLGNEFEDRY